MLRVLGLTAFLIAPSAFSWAAPSLADYERCAATIEQNPECAYDLMVAEASPDNTPDDLVRLMLGADRRSVLSLLHIGDGYDHLSAQGVLDAADEKIASIAVGMSAEEQGRVFMWMDAWPKFLIGSRLYRSACTFLRFRSGALIADERRFCEIAERMMTDPAGAFRKWQEAIGAPRPESFGSKREEAAWDLFNPRDPGKISYWRMFAPAFVRALIAGGEVEEAATVVAYYLDEEREMSVVLRRVVEEEFLQPLQPFGHANLDRFIDLVGNASVRNFARIGIARGSDFERAFRAASAIDQDWLDPKGNGKHYYTELIQQRVVAAHLRRQEYELAARKFREYGMDADPSRSKPIEERILIERIRNLGHAGDLEGIGQLLKSSPFLADLVARDGKSLGVAAQVAAAGMSEWARAHVEGDAHLTELIEAAIAREERPSLVPLRYYGAALEDRLGDAVMLAREDEGNARLEALRTIYLFAESTRRLRD